MKKNYQSVKTFSVLLILLATQAGAQLSGVVTIDNGSPSSASNFTSFTAFAAVINTAGVSGPLIVNVAATSTVYNEQVSFIQAPGISATNSVTINGNGRTISFNSAASANPHTLVLNGADFMTFNNLNIVGLGTFALTVHLWNGADNNRFSTCIMSSPLNGISTTQVPYSISGSATSGTGSGSDAGNNNIVTTCTISGGYYNTMIYGRTSAPFSTGNQVLNSSCVDFYFYGMYNAYAQLTTFKGNVIERINRSTLTTAYGIFLTTGTLDAMIEGNHVRRLFEQALTAGNTAFCIYVLAGASQGRENYIRNNVVSDIKSGSGLIYGIYSLNYAFTIIDHNTVVLDEAVATAGTTYGIYAHGNGTKIRNNLVYVSRTGTGLRACLYVANPTNMVVNYNVLNMLSVGTGTALASNGTAFATLAAWQTATGNDMNSSTALPAFSNPLAMDYTPTSAAVNNLCAPVGVTTDFNNVARSPLFPDPGAYEIFNTICSGIPGANSFTVPTTVFCPGATVDLALQNSNSYLNTNYAIAWQTSTNSAVGPFTTIATATLNAYTVPSVTLDAHYRAIITCLSGGSYTTTSQFVDMAATTTSAVPYDEGFENFSQNKLPNCSWSASNMGGTTLTYSTPGSNYRAPRTGSNYASFFRTPSGTSYFYSNGIQLTAGVTYSAGIWFIQETANFNNWDLSLQFGTSQTPSGLTNIVSSNGTLTPQLYTLLSDTFQVPLSGLYYIAIKGTSGGGVAPYLSVDDLFITTPCEKNGPNLGLSVSAATICAGQTANLTGYGANGYSWNTGQTSPVITVAPLFPTTYILVGAHTLSGCTKTLTQFIDVQQSPAVQAYINGPTGCAGKPINLSASGAVTYFWNTGANVSSTIVSPTVTTTYSVVGTNNIGCSTIASIQVTIAPAPNVTVPSPAIFVCKDDQLTLTANGAATYQWWVSSAIVYSGNPISINQTSSSTYTILGFDAKGCEGKTYLTIDVSDCTGLNTITKADAVKVYPNPATGIFVIELPAMAQTVEISDVTGRIVLSQSEVASKSSFDISTLANGIYYVKVATENSTEVIKVVKNNN